MSQEDNAGLIPFDQWKDEIEVRAAQYSGAKIPPWILLGILLAITLWGMLPDGKT